MIKVPHVEKVKEQLGKDSIEALTAIFNQLEGSPPSVRADRFRADNPVWLDLLDDLQHNKSLIERSSDCKGYILRCYALPLIEHKHAEHILKVMKEISSSS